VGERELIAVVQNAPPTQEYGRFGLVPLWLPEHVGFVQQVVIEPAE
jgi:hypothetical protein